MAWVYGIHAVEELLEGEPGHVQEIWIVRSRKPGPARERVRTAAELQGVRFRMVDDAQLQRVVGDVKHQGVAARVAEFVYAEAETVLAAEGPAVVLVLDEVQDPHNLGAILRTAAGLGAAGVVIPRHRSASVTAAVRKVAVGAEQRIPVAQVTNLARFLEDARKAGFWIYGMVADGAESLGGASLAERTVFVMGSEGRGIRPNVAARCDVALRIPMGDLESLNVSVAAGIALWEWRRGKNG
jgi:23S rRNA (guanosine2251-2'-O)-methyltransferase